jgi:K+-sensing histidine kinase KdpD
MFGRILVVADDSPIGRAALNFAHRMASDYGADVRLVSVSQANSHPGRVMRFPISKEIDVEVGQTGHSLSGTTRSRRDKQIVGAVAACANEYGAEVIVFGLDQRRRSERAVSRRLRRALAAATELPMLFPPDSLVEQTDPSIATIERSSAHV